MMTSRQLRDVGGSFASRRGHASQLSISDPSHHVTEAIGTLYGDDDGEYSGNDNRPLSFIANPHGGEHLQNRGAKEVADDPRRPLVRSTSDMAGATSLSPNGPNGIKKAQTMPARIVNRRSTSYDNNSPVSPMSPTLSLRDVQEADTAGSQFPLTNIDNPNDIAQELSNLQALRRMSMDVGNSTDPDMMPFQSMSLMAMPSIAPSGDDDEADPSRLLWVPARVHPELAPSEFQNFLEGRVRSLKRRSGESMLSPDGVARGDSGSLRRKKSMLSRQVDPSGGRGAENRVDGAERLERKQSVNGDPDSSDLTLDDLVKNPSRVAQKLAQEMPRTDVGETSMEDDMPILPVAPGMGLRRSTRTTYRKGGSIRSGDRVPFSKRVLAAARQTAKEGEDTAVPSPIEPPKGHGLTRVQTEPVAENYSRPTRSVRRQHNFSRDSGSTGSLLDGASHTDESSRPSTSASQEQNLPVRTSSASDPRSSIPQILEPPPADESNDEQPAQASRQFPARSSSQKGAQALMPQQIQTQESIPEEPPARSSKRPGPARSGPSSSSSSSSQPTLPPQNQHQRKATLDRSSNAQSQTLGEMVQSPSPLPGGGATRTDSLTFIPTVDREDRRSEERPKKERDDTESVASTRSAGWNKWFKSNSEEKEKKKKDEESRRTKSQKTHDNARLDVLQNSIDTVKTKGRESLLLDRDNVDYKLNEERKKESSRKSSESKKSKDGLFSSFFGSSKKKGDRESSSSKKHQQRAASPEPVYRPLRPDVDYNWTRFPIIEERAIYRLAHLKLANPRRPLHSQVLLSNFMYAYLAKVQAMHPQIQVPISPQQRRQEEERKRREQEQRWAEQQQMEQQLAQDNMDQYNFEYHRSENQYGDTQHDGIDYVDDAQVYEYDHGGEIGDHDGGYQEDYDRQGGQADYYGYEQRDNNDSQRHRQDDNDMW